MMSTSNVLYMVARTSVGKVRELNEDNFISTDNINGKEWYLPKKAFTNPPEGSLMAIADGMGGLNAGEVASGIAIESVKEYFSRLAPKAYKDNKIQSLLKAGVLYAHRAILTRSLHDKDLGEIGTTLVIAWIVNGKLFIAWSGDSRCYHYRESTGLRQLSKDHSYVQSLVDEGKITAEQAFFHPQSNIVTQSLGDSERDPKPDVSVSELVKDDIIILCSDGLSGMLTDAGIEEIVRSGKDNIQQCADELIGKANEAGGVDNITVILAKVLEGPPGKDKGKAGKEDRAKKKKSRRPAVILVCLVFLLAAVGIIYMVFGRGAKKPATDTGQPATQKHPVNHDTAKEKGDPGNVRKRRIPPADTPKLTVKPPGMEKREPPVPDSSILHVLRPDGKRRDSSAPPDVHQPPKTSKRDTV